MYSPPSALYHTEGIRRRPVADSVALFLPYDGTLKPIVDNADGGALLDETRATM